MRFAGVLILIFLSSVTIFAQKYPCLPSEVKEDTVVSTTTSPDSSSRVIYIPVTVLQTLKKLKAKCSRSKLIDRKGKQIRFYNLQGCWGNPPYDYNGILDRQKNEIAKLRKRFTVIEMTCNPGGIPPAMS